MSEGLGVIAGWRPRIVVIEACGGVVASWSAAPAKAVTTLARECPRVRLVLGDVIDIGERQVLVFVQGAEARGIPFERVSNDDVPIAGAASRNG